LATHLHHWLDDDRPWTAHASCRLADPELFFAEDADTEYALRICSGCPVREECLDWALVTEAAYGVWGGTTEEERRQLRHSGS
jgi:WhiB family redox-sensing transcriptional regulator